MRRAFLAAFAALVPWPLAAAQFVPGHLFVAGWKTKIWEVDPKTWTVTLFADQTKGLNGVSSLQYFTGDVLLETNYYDNQILSFDSTGVATPFLTSAQGLTAPYGENGLSTTMSGDLYISNYGSKQVLMLPAGASSPGVLADASDGIVHADGIATDASGRLWIANRDGLNVLMLDLANNAQVVDTLPDMPMTIAVRNNGDVYVGCFYGDVYRYKAGDPKHRSRLVTFNRTLGTPVLRFGLAYNVLYMTSSNLGNLLSINPDDGTYKEVLPVGTFATPVSLEVAGVRDDVGLWTYGAGKAGSRGVVPTLDASGHPIIDWSLTTELRDFAPNTNAIIAVSGTSADDSLFGGDLLVSMDDSTRLIPITFSGGLLIGGASYDWTQQVPIDPNLVGHAYYLQVFDFDPGAAGGVSSSNGLGIVIRMR